MGTANHQALIWAVRTISADATISAEAFAARRTMRGWILGAQHLQAVGGAAAGVQVLDQAGAVEEQLQRMVAAAPHASPSVAKAVREAYVLYYRATGAMLGQGREIKGLGDLVAKKGDTANAEYAAALGDLQALMILDVSELRHRTRRKGLPQVYVEYLAVAPDNRGRIRRPRLVIGCGSAMLWAARSLSEQSGWKGRIGLHSLPGALRFYGSHGFRDLGSDADEGGCHYMEFSGRVRR